MAFAYRAIASLEAKEDRRWNISTSHEDDSSKPNASCLRAAEERLSVMVRTPRTSPVMRYFFCLGDCHSVYISCSVFCNFFLYDRSRSGWLRFLLCEDRKVYPSSMGPPVITPRISTSGEGFSAALKAGELTVRAVTRLVSRCDPRPGHRASRPPCGPATK